MTARSLASFSRFCSHSYSYPDPRFFPESFRDFVVKIADANNADFVLPMTDVSTMVLAPDGRLGGRLMCPPLSAYEELSDKAKLMTRASRLGIATPVTHIASNMADAMEATSRLRPPIVIKPARSKYWHSGCIHATHVSVASTPSDAARLLAEADWFGAIPALLQEFVAGVGAGVFALFEKGEPIAWFAHKRVREKPPQGGVSVLCQSAPLDRVLVHHCSTLLRSVSWSGPAMIEFKISNAGEPYLMEVNGRFWGSLQLAIDCGVDFPWLLYRSMKGDCIEGIFDYSIGRQLRWFFGDLDSTLIQVLDSAGVYSRAQKLLAVMRLVGATLDPRIRSEILRLDDPVPALFESGQWIAAALRGRL